MCVVLLFFPDVLLAVRTIVAAYCQETTNLIKIENKTRNQKQQNQKKQETKGQESQKQENQETKSNKGQTARSQEAEKTTATKATTQKATKSRIQKPPKPQQKIDRKARKARQEN